MKPHTSIPKKNQKKKGKSKVKVEATEPPHELKFWHLVILVFNTSREVPVTATVDLRTKSVHIDLPNNALFLFSSNYCDYLFELFEEAFSKAVDTLTQRPDFDGALLKDVPALLAMIELPAPKNFWWSDEFFLDPDKEYWDEWGDDDWSEEEDGMDEEEEDEGSSWATECDEWEDDGEGDDEDDEEDADEPEDKPSSSGEADNTVSRRSMSPPPPFSRREVYDAIQRIRTNESTDTDTQLLIQACADNGLWAMVSRIQEKSRYRSS